jgi:lipopolysaccharide biosynthesis glycosyltransferase
MKPLYNIVTSCDNGFAQHASVMLASLFSHHPNCSFQVFILVPVDFSEENALKVVASVNTDSSAIKIIRVADNRVSDLKIDGHVTSATYLRLRMGDLLPATLGRVVYLDSDIIINGNVTELFEVDLLGFPFGAVPDAWVDQAKEVRTKIGLDANARYFNCGVLVIDLPRWIYVKLEERALSYCRSHPDAITYWDQCALNHVVNGKFYLLDEKWNFQSTSSRSGLNSALIVHFTGAVKPWHIMCAHPLKHLYFKYSKKTVWMDFKPHWTHVDSKALIKRALGPTMSRAAAITARKFRSVLR